MKIDFIGSTLQYECQPLEYSLPLLTNGDQSAKVSFLTGSNTLKIKIKGKKTKTIFPKAKKCALFVKMVTQHQMFCMSYTVIKHSKQVTSK